MKGLNLFFLNTEEIKILVLNNCQEQLTLCPPLHSFTILNSVVHKLRRVQNPRRIGGNVADHTNWPEEQHIKPLKPYE